MRTAPDRVVGLGLQTHGLTVRFGATVALDDVNLELRPGEVHALVGENGAGKSTLMRCLAGVLPPSEGHIDYPPTLKITWVPQEPDLPPDLTVREWIFLGAESRGPLRMLRKQSMDAAANGALNEIGSDLSPGNRLGALTAAQRKQVQLARAVRQRPQVLLLDEPTAVLGAHETEGLFAMIRNIRQSGGTVLYVSHRLDEVRAIADRVTVLRDGRRVATSLVRDVDTATLVEQMVGRVIPPNRQGRRVQDTIGLTIRGLFVGPVRDLSLSVLVGEIVGLAGLLGAGRSEVLETVAGLTRATAGYITLLKPLAFVAEDRGRKGVVPQLDVRSNIFLPAAPTLLRHRQERREAEEWVQRLPIQAESVDAPITSLSGGNQQKVLLARALRQSPKLLLLDEPTAGVDVGAKAQIHQIIAKVAFDGTAVLIASSDLPELLSLCDRIIALRDGRAVGSFEAAATNEAEIAACITGARVSPPPAPAATADPPGPS